MSRVWRQSEKYGAASGVHLETFRNVRDAVDGRLRGILDEAVILRDD